LVSDGPARGVAMAEAMSSSEFYERQRALRQHLAGPLPGERLSWFHAQVEQVHDEHCRLW
jgi:hypothetical protein